MVHCKNQKWNFSVYETHKNLINIWRRLGLKIFYNSFFSRFLFIISLYVNLCLKTSNKSYICGPKMCLVWVVYSHAYILKAHQCECSIWHSDFQMTLIKKQGRLPSNIFVLKFIHSLNYYDSKYQDYDNIKHMKRIHFFQLIHYRGCKNTISFLKMRKKGLCVAMSFKIY